MYRVAVKRCLCAEHFLPECRKPAERIRHGHNYVITVELEGDTLDAQGFLLDIDDAGRHLEAVAALCQGKVLNEIPEFGGLSPSIELLARFLCSAFCGRITAPAVTAVAVTVAEDADACAMYRKELVCASD